jgi:hypothetical protein
MYLMEGFQTPIPTRFASANMQDQSHKAHFLQTSVTRTFYVSIKTVCIRKRSISC